MSIVVIKIILACDCFFLHFQPEKLAEGLLLFIQGLGLGKTCILHVLFVTQCGVFVVLEEV